MLPMWALLFQIITACQTEQIFQILNDLNVKTKNIVEIIGHPDNIIEIRVTDRTGRCPVSYQQSQENWNSNVFSKFVR
jgi:hypothetical protein